MALPAVLVLTSALLAADRAADAAAGGSCGVRLVAQRRESAPCVMVSGPGAHPANGTFGCGAAPGEGRAEGSPAQMWAQGGCTGANEIRNLYH
eukprot:SAG31_NODE_7096_length_1789_cov_4.807692_3_plen_93_part_00